MIQLFGRLPSLPDLRDFQFASFLRQELRGKYAIPAGAKIWECDTVLDQGQPPHETHCIGFALAQFCNAEPIANHMTAQDADNIYYAAKFIDGNRAGQPLDESGTTLRSGAKALRDTMKRIDAYAFTKSVNDIALWTLNKSPVVMATYWFEGMMQIDESGFVKVEGQTLGGHAWLILGANYSNPLDPFFIGLNSFGVGWGDNGRFKITAKDLSILLREQGEAMTAVELPKAN